MGCRESKPRQQEEPTPAPAPAPPPAVAASPPAEPEPALTYRASRQLLGRGGSAVVYVGVCEQTMEPVAIKRVQVSSTAVQQALEREYETLRTLPSHPNVVKVQHFEVNGTDGVIVLELVRGGTLRRLCNATPKKRLHERVLRLYMRDVLVGLQHLHRQGVLHRDLKPDNILVSAKVSDLDASSSVDATASPLVKITDFGSCKYALHGGVCQTTVNVVGTVPYMSPEAVRGKFSFGSDIWAWAITFIELATPGQRPVWSHLNARDTFGLLVKIGSLTAADCVPPMPETLSPRCRELLRSCLAFSAANRPNCDALLESDYFAVMNNEPEGIESVLAYEAAGPEG